MNLSGSQIRLNSAKKSKIEIYRKIGKKNKKEIFIIFCPQQIWPTIWNIIDPKSAKTSEKSTIHIEICPYEKLKCPINQRTFSEKTVQIGRNDPFLSASQVIDAIKIFNLQTGPNVPAEDAFVLDGTQKTAVNRRIWVALSDVFGLLRVPEEDSSGWSMWDPSWRSTVRYAENRRYSWNRTFYF